MDEIVIQATTALVLYVQDNKKLKLWLASLKSKGARLVLNKLRMNDLVKEARLGLSNDLCAPTVSMLGMDWDARYCPVVQRVLKRSTYEALEDLIVYHSMGLVEQALYAGVDTGNFLPKELSLLRHDAIAHTVLRSPGGTQWVMAKVEEGRIDVVARRSSGYIATGVRRRDQWESRTMLQEVAEELMANSDQITHLQELRASKRQKTSTSAPKNENAAEVKTAYRQTILESKMVSKYMWAVPGLGDVYHAKAGLERPARSATALLSANVIFGSLSDVLTESMELGSNIKHGKAWLDAEQEYRGETARSTQVTLYSSYEGSCWISRSQICAETVEKLSAAISEFKSGPRVVQRNDRYDMESVLLAGVAQRMSAMYRLRGLKQGNCDEMIVLVDNTDKICGAVERSENRGNFCIRREWLAERVVNTLEEISPQEQESSESRCSISHRDLMVWFDAIHFECGVDVAEKWLKCIGRNWPNYLLRQVAAAADRELESGFGISGDTPEVRYTRASVPPAHSKTINVIRLLKADMACGARSTRVRSQYAGRRLEVRMFKNMETKAKFSFPRTFKIEQMEPEAMKSFQAAVESAGCKGEIGNIIPLRYSFKTKQAGTKNKLRRYAKDALVFHMSGADMVIVGVAGDRRQATWLKTGRAAQGGGVVGELSDRAKLVLLQAGKQFGLISHAEFEYGCECNGSSSELLDILRNIVVRKLEADRSVSKVISEIRKLTLAFKVETILEDWEMLQRYVMWTAHLNFSLVCSTGGCWMNLAPECVRMFRSTVINVETLFPLAYMPRLGNLLVHGEYAYEVEARPNGIWHLGEAKQKPVSRLDVFDLGNSLDGVGSPRDKPNRAA